MPEADLTQNGSSTGPEKKSAYKRAIAKFGFWGAMAFFTIKGLLYLIIPVALTYFSCG